MTRLAYLALGIFAGVVITLSLRREPTTARAPILGPQVGRQPRLVVGVERLGPDLIAEDDWEAGDYIEDDPKAWAEFLDTFQEYACQLPALSAHFNNAEQASSVLAGAMLSKLAGKYSLFLERHE